MTARWCTATPWSSSTAELSVPGVGPREVLLLLVSRPRPLVMVARCSARSRSFVRGALHLDRACAPSWLASPRESRWRRLLPEEAGTGAAAQRAAKLASPVSRSGLLPAVTSSCAATSGPTPTAARSAGLAALVSSSIRAVRVWTCRPRSRRRAANVFNAVSTSAVVGSA